MYEYPIIEVPPDAANRTEWMGSKEKFWFGEPDETRRLFKFGRPQHGEDWAEKIAAEIAGVLGIPHAEIELATCDGKPGTVSPDFCHGGGFLVHGNELMVDQVDPSYPASGSKMLVKQHTVANAMKVLADIADPPHGLAGVDGVEDAAGAFVGYLMLDALIGNTDRHHENWAVSFWDDEATGVDAVLAPSFDHASSLGRELSDEERLARLDGKDRNRTVERYLARAEGRFFGSDADARPLSPLDAFRRAADMRPKAAAGWLERLRGVAGGAFEHTNRRIPAARMSEPARRFALQMIELNRGALLGEKGMA